MKWYNLETIFKSLRDALRVYLKKNNIRYELSAAGAYYHFEIYASPAQAAAINAFIDAQSIQAV